MEYGPYTIQEDGYVELPKELRRDYRLYASDAVVFEPTDDGWLIRPDTYNPMRPLNELGELHRARHYAGWYQSPPGESCAANRRERYGVEGEDETTNIP